MGSKVSKIHWKVRLLQGKEVVRSQGVQLANQRSLWSKQLKVVSPAAMQERERRGA
jgi:hypothetical protein